MIWIGTTGAPSLLLFALAVVLISRSTLNPWVNWPKMVCLKSSCRTLPSVMKNCEPLVPFSSVEYPAFAIAIWPLPVNIADGENSLSKE